jgi:hypothetical protein
MDPQTVPRGDAYCAPAFCSSADFLEYFNHQVLTRNDLPLSIFFVHSIHGATPRGDLANGVINHCIPFAL